jgi:superfamily II DNA or RNA helicase
VKEFLDSFLATFPLPYRIKQVMSSLTLNHLPFSYGAPDADRFYSPADSYSGDSDVKAANHTPRVPKPLFPPRADSIRIPLALLTQRNFPKIRKTENLPEIGNSPFAFPIPGCWFKEDFNDRIILPGRDDDGIIMDFPVPDKDLIVEAPAKDREAMDLPSGESKVDEPVGDSPISPDASLWCKIRRPYQQEIIEAWLRHAQMGGDRGLVVIPTGTGKTFTFVESLWELSKLSAYAGKKILVIAHQEQIVAQNAAALAARFGKDQIGIVQGPVQEWDQPILSASVQTLINHLDEINWHEFGLVVVDEAHHYVEGNEWFDVLQRLGFFDANSSPVDQSGQKMLLGFTATPDRLSGKPLVSVYGTNLLYTRDINFFINQKYLLKSHGIKVNLVGVDDNGQDLTPKKIWQNMTLDEKADLLANVMFNPHFHRGPRFKKTVAFLGARDEVEGLEEILNRVYGINAVGVLDDTPYRAQKLADFKAGKYDVLLNIRIATEGYDDPGIEAIVLASATMSRSLVVQEIGRALRPDPEHPERNEAVIADLAGNLDFHEINIPAEESYTWGEQDRKLRSESQTGTRKPQKKSAPMSYQWNSIELGHFIDEKNNLLMPLLRTHLADEEAVIQAAYRAGLTSDKVMLWWHGAALPETVSELETLDRVLALPNNQLRLAYEESVSGAIKAYLIQILQEFAVELKRTPKQDELGGKYPSPSTYLKYFGSFNDALRAAGLDVTHTMGELTKERAIEILRQAASELQTAGKEISRDNFNQIRNDAHPDWPAVSTICKAITGDEKKWNDALRAAGLDPMRTRSELTRRSAIEILQQAASKLQAGGEKISVNNFDKIRKNAHPGWPSIPTICRAITGDKTAWNDALLASALDLTFTRHAMGSLTRENAIEILQQGNSELKAVGKKTSIPNFEQTRKKNHPDWPSVQTICQAITGDATKWNDALLAAGLLV